MLKSTTIQGENRAATVAPEERDAATLLTQWMNITLAADFGLVTAAQVTLWCANLTANERDALLLAIQEQGERLYKDWAAA